MILVWSICGWDEPLIKRLQKVFHRGKTQQKAPPIRQIAALTGQTLQAS